MTGKVEGDLLVFVRDIFVNKKGGILRQTLQKIKRSLYFDNGFLIFAHSNVKREKIGQILLKHGILDNEAELEQLLKVKGKKLLGAFLLEQGIITPDELNLVIEEQIKSIFKSVYTHPINLTWEEKKNPVMSELTVPISIPQLLEDIILHEPKPERFEKYLPDPDSFIVPSESSYMERSEFQSEDHLIKSIISQPTPLKNIFTQANIDKKEIIRRVYMGLVFGYFTVQEASKFKGVAKNLYSVTNPQVNPLPPDWEDFAAHVKDMTPYEAFALRPDATLKEIQRRYQQLCDWLHPIYYAPHITYEKKRKLKHLIDTIAEYYDILRTHVLAQTSGQFKIIRSEKEKTKAPEDILNEISREVERGQYIRAAKMLKENRKLISKNPLFYYLSGVILSQQRETWQQAEVAFKKAIEMDPENVDFQLELAVFYYHIGLKLKSFDILRRILLKHPDHEKAKYLMKLYQENRAHKEDE